jgi:lysophospholipase L1-like esterase
MKAAGRGAATAALSLTSILITLGALELGARFFSDPSGGNAALVAQRAEARARSIHVKSDDPELIYVNRPGYGRDDVRFTEVHGIVRSRDVDEARGGAFRIAVLGDSIAAAHPIRSGGRKSFSEQLEDRLNVTRAAGGAPVEVLNFGTDGYGTLQEARLLETKAARFTPDVVIVAYCLNDPSNSYTPTVWFLDHPEPRFYLLDLVQRRLGATPSELSPAHPRYTHGTIEWDRLYRADGPAWQGVEQGLARIARYGEEHDVPTLLVLFPLLLTGQEPGDEQELAQQLYEQVSETATRHRMRFVDLRAAYRPYTASQLRLIAEDPIHPNALGHELAAEAIAAALPSDGQPYVSRVEPALP